jgi:hypothetical protein
MAARDAQETRETKRQEAPNVYWIKTVIGDRQASAKKPASVVI